MAATKEDAEIGVKVPVHVVPPVVAEADEEAFTDVVSVELGFEALELASPGTHCE